MEIDAEVFAASEKHRDENSHEVAIRPGIGWVCSVCDPDIYEEFVQPQYDKDGPSIRRIPNWRFKDWPGKVEGDFKEGRFTLQNEYDGARCDIYVGYGQGNSAGLTLTEMIVLHREIGKAIDELTDLDAQYGYEAQPSAPTVENTPRITNHKES